MSPELAAFIHDHQNHTTHRNGIGPQVGCPQCVALNWVKAVPVQQPAIHPARTVQEIKNDYQAARTRTGKYVHLTFSGSIRSFCGVYVPLHLKGGLAAVTCQACIPNARGEHN